MLIFKILEGLVRLIWNVSFDRSKHTVDTGLFGTIGLVARRKRELARRTNRQPSRPSRADSDATTQHMLPPGGQTTAASRSRTTVSGPPSVLRPEQLNQPYREDSDDESGYILGAWHYDDDLAIETFTPPAPLTPPPQPTTQAQPSSGFSRIAGGRANIDSPYTMAAGSSTAFASPAATTSTAQEATSTSTANLPPGAMAPGQVASHVRRKSQSAIIEDTSTLLAAKGTSATTGSNAGAQRRKNWLSRALFSDNARSSPRRTLEPTEPSLPDEGPSPDGSSRTFVVIRNRKPSPLSQAQLPEEQETTTPDEGAKSFTVVRPQRAGGSVTGPSAGEASSA